MPEVSLFLNAGGMGRLDNETETIITTLDANYGRLQGASNQDLNTGQAMLVPYAFHGSQDPDVSGDVTHPLGRNRGLETCIAFQPRYARNGRGKPNAEVVPPLTAEAGQTGKGDSATCVAFAENSTCIGAAFSSIISEIHGDILICIAGKQVKYFDPYFGGILIIGAIDPAFNFIGQLNPGII